MTDAASDGGSSSSYSDRDTRDLDDRRDRDELRRRYYGLLQELRVILPGVQVLLAFLLTVPFAQGFDQLDDAGLTLFGVGLTSAMFSVLCFVGPVILHRLGERTARSFRLRWSIRLTVAGMLLLGVALVSSMWCVARYIYGDGTALWLMIPVVVVLVAVWAGLPLLLRQHHVAPGADAER